MEITHNGLKSTPNCILDYVKKVDNADHPDPTRKMAEPQSCYYLEIGIITGIIWGYHGGFYFLNVSYDRKLTLDEQRFIPDNITNRPDEALDLEAIHELINMMVKVTYSLMNASNNALVKLTSIRDLPMVAPPTD